MPAQVTVIVKYMHITLTNKAPFRVCNLNPDPLSSHSCGICLCDARARGAP